MLELECRESLGQLADLEETWRDLERRCPEPFTYFQSADWCLNWARTFLSDTSNSGVSPKVYVLWDGAECLMIWPPMTRRVSPAITALVPLTAPMNSMPPFFMIRPLRSDLGRMVFDEIEMAAGQMRSPSIMCRSPALLAQLLQGGDMRPTDAASSILDCPHRQTGEATTALPKKQRLQRNSRRTTGETGCARLPDLVAGSEGLPKYRPLHARAAG